MGESEEGWWREALSEWVRWAGGGRGGRAEGVERGPLSEWVRWAGRNAVTVCPP